MKTLKILLVLVAVILSGFSKDSQTDGTKERVVVPMKVTCTILPDDAGGLIMCTPEAYGINHRRYGFLEGHQTHGGKLITEQSTWEILSCSTDLATGINVSDVVGMNTVANGDTYTYNCIMFININTNDVTLYVTLTGGAGRFEGATGEILLTGGLTGHGIPCRGEGFISFLK